MWYLQGLCSFFYYNTTLFFACLKTLSQFLVIFCKVFVTLGNSKEATWPLGSFGWTKPYSAPFVALGLASAKIPNLGNDDLHFNFSPRLSTSSNSLYHCRPPLCKTLSHFQLAIVAVGISLGFKRARRRYESFAKYWAMGNGQWAMRNDPNIEQWVMSNGQQWTISNGQ